MYILCKHVCMYNYKAILEIRSAILGHLDYHALLEVSYEYNYTHLCVHDWGFVVRRKAVCVSYWFSPNASGYACIICM